MSDDSLDFSSLKTITVPVAVGSRNFTLREANGLAVSRWRAAKMRGVQTQGDDANRKVTIVEPSVTADTDLVASCLVENEKGGAKEVPRHVVEAWPDRVFRQVFKTLLKISELEGDDLKALRKERDDLDARIAKLETEGDPAGNAPGNSEDGSASPSPSE